MSWQQAYFAHRRLEAAYGHISQEHAGFRELVECSAEGPRALERRIDVQRMLAAKHGWPLPEPSLLAELQALANLRRTYDVGAAEFIFDDVYHVAFHHLAEWRVAGQVVLSADESLFIYRGQRDYRWSIGPKIYRELPPGNVCTNALGARAAKACQVGRAVARKLAVSFDDAMAIVQHFSGDSELNVPTWLMDFSLDPWVALFFASDGGRDGALGVVWRLFQTEHKRLSDGPDNPIGPLGPVVPRGIARISNQYGVFISSMHPSFMDQSVPMGSEARFSQRAGLTFEDPSVGVAQAIIYPATDPTWEAISDLGSSSNACGCDATSCQIPAMLFADPTKAPTYFRVLKSWLTNAKFDPSEPISDATLTLLAAYHAELHAPQHTFESSVSRSLNRLVDAFNDVFISSPQCSVVEAINRAYLGHLPSDADRLLLASIRIAVCGC